MMETILENKKLLIITISTILAITLILGGALFYKNSIKKPAPTPSPTPEATPTALPSPTTHTFPDELSDTSTFPTPIATPKSTPTPKPTPTPTPTPTPSPTPAATVTVKSQSGVDGFRSSNGGGNNGDDIRVGRNVNLITRGFVSFTLPAELAGKTVDTATLRLYQYKIDGSPYSVGGSINIEHLIYGDTLDDSDYGMTLVDSNGATLGGNNTTTEWKQAGVGAAVKADVDAGRTHSQFRLRFGSESQGGDVPGDFAHFYSSNAGFNTQPPELVIAYH